jgi:BirA family biotin operon repressor/biotin-[acetyl-CoA-carboxylase] ligase
VTSAAAGSLSHDAVAPRLRGRFGTPYLYEPECESTQLLLLGSGLPEGAVAATDHQTAGRGRMGRAWIAPPRTAVLASMLLRPPVDRQAPELSLVAAVAVAEAIDVATGLSAQVKWPNDLMLDRRKVAGILAELSDGAVVIGVGLNVNQTRDELPLAAPTAAASLRTLTGTTYDRAELLASLLASVERSYGAWRDGGLDSLYDDLGARDFLRGRRVTADGAKGTAIGIRRDGRLEVDLDAGGRRVIESGEVRFER